MKIEQLPRESRSKLEELLRSLEQSLNDSPSPHTRAVSAGFMPNGWTASDVLDGGRIRAPSQPPFAYDKRLISGLHRALLQSGDGVLFGVIVHAERPDTEARWRLQSKLMSRSERRALDEHRRSIDVEVERELRPLAREPDWEWISFGRNKANKAPELLMRTATGLTNMEPSAKLLGLLKSAEDIYGSANLELLIADWALRPAGIEFVEQIE
jgi:hypothetical protein